MALLLHRRAAVAVGGNATDAAAAAHRSRNLLAEAKARSEAGGSGRTDGSQGAEERRAQAGAGVEGGARGGAAGGLRGAGPTRRGRNAGLGFGVGAGARREARSRQRAAEQPLEERRAQQLAWEKCALPVQLGSWPSCAISRCMHEVKRSSTCARQSALRRSHE